MPLFVPRTFSNLIIPLGWTIITIALLCLPGSAMPGTGVFKIESIDEIAHVVLFGGMVLFWALFFRFRIPETSRWIVYIIRIVFIVILIGVALEYVQRDYIPQRSFEFADIAIDAISSIVTGVLLMIFKTRFRSKREIK